MIDLDAIKARVAAATPGPWEWMPAPWSFDPRVLARRVGDNVATSFQVIDADPSGDEYALAIDPAGADATFIAHARADVPALVEEVERLREALEEAQLRSIEARNPGIDIEDVRRRMHRVDL